MKELDSKLPGEQAAPEAEAKLPPRRAVVIGASSGAIDALHKILPHLQGDFPGSVMIVIHLPPDRESMLAQLFAVRCRMKVKEAEDKEPLEDGMIYFAPPNYHLLVESNYSLSLSSDDPVLYSRPSIDVLFETAADAYGSDLIGVVLTGANNDGAAGLRAVGLAGGLALVQNPHTAECPTMPAAALNACPGSLSLSLPEIVETLKTWRRSDGPA